MIEEKKHVFLSYCRDNEPEVKQLRDDLIAAGEFVWWDQDIHPGQDWKFEIRQAMRTAYAVVLCLSEESEARVASGIYPEAMDAINLYRELTPGSIFLIPVRLSPCKIPPVEIDGTRTLDRLQYQDLFPSEKYAASLQKLLGAIQSTPCYPPRAARQITRTAPTGTTTSVTPPATSAISEAARVGGKKILHLLLAALVIGIVAAAGWLLWNSRGHKVIGQPAGPIVKVPPALIFMGQPANSSSWNESSEESVKSAQRVAAAHPNDAHALSDAGNMIANAGDTVRGGELLSQAHNLAPTDAIISYNYARNLYSQGKIDDAIQQANLALAQKPDLDQARLLVADAAVQRKDFAAAEQQVDKLKVVIKDIEIAAFTIRGVILLEKGKVKEAQDMFQQALVLAGDDAIALYNAGVAQQRGNNLSAAQDYYQRALQQDPNLSEAHNNLATVFSELGDPQKAFDEFHAAAISSPENSLFAANLSQSSLQAGEPADKIVGTWEIEGGQLSISGTMDGRTISQSVQIPSSSRITFSKASAGGYMAQESALGTELSTTFQQQTNGSYSAPTVVPPELAKSLPPGASDIGTVTFWVRGQTLFGDTVDTLTAPKTTIKTRRTWKARRISVTVNEHRASHVLATASQAQTVPF